MEAKSYNANEFGLYNMAGNVAEWTYTAYNEASYGLGSTMNPSVEDLNNPKKSNSRGVLERCRLFYGSKQ
jgi:formylglycine-generating enzyme required for sulfatase activity